MTEGIILCDEEWMMRFDDSAPMNSPALHESQGVLEENRL
jgi:hypothetical protein